MTKAEQLYKNKSPRVKRDKAYLEWFAKQIHKCFICGTTSNIEGHHVKMHSSDPKNDSYIIPLCAEHHRYSHEISPHSNAKAWRETYSYEMQLDYAEKIYQGYKCTCIQLPTNQ